LQDAVIHYYSSDDEKRYVSVNSYFLDWFDVGAEAFALEDVTDEKSQIEELETHAYQDPLTGLHNRYSGMQVLEKWLEEKKKFSLIFVDLDNLKYINDVYGHGEGDTYLLNAAKGMKMISEDAVAARVGGDEFMLLVPGACFDTARSGMVKVCENVENDSYLSDKDFYYGLSFGIVAIDEKNELPSSNILATADDRMYEMKRERKKNRQAGAR
jgi:diguanylate cyclase (GGDEF)-like protein